MKFSVRALARAAAGIAVLAVLGGCVTGTPLHARSELAKENNINRIAIFGSGRVIWPRLGGKEPVIGLEASKQTLEFTLPMVKKELGAKGYQSIVVERVGVLANPTYKQDWVFPLSGEFQEPEEKTEEAPKAVGGELPPEPEKADKTSSFGRPYQLKNKAPAFVYDGYAKDPAALSAAKSVFDFLDSIPPVFPASESKIADSNPPADALQLLGSRTGADTLCFARVTGNRFTKARKAAVVAMNAATIWFGVVMIPPQDSAHVNLACYDVASGKLAWHSPFGAYLGDPEAPNDGAITNGLRYFPQKGKPILASCKPDEKKSTVFSCSDPET